MILPAPLLGQAERVATTGKMGDKERTAAQKQLEKEEHLQFVAELAGPDDAWVTPVDAARITGVSESAAQRWVTSGRLPICGDPITRTPRLFGIPPRTRKVRVSDIKQLHPILYPEQGISTIARILDIQSIPLEIWRLTDEHRHITTDHRQLLQTVSELNATVTSGFEQLHTALQRQAEETLANLRVAQEEAARLLAEAEARLVQTQNQLRQDLQQVQTDAQQQQARQKQALTDMREQVAHDLAEHKEQIQKTVGNLAAEQRHAMERFRESITERLATAEKAAERQMGELEKRILVEIAAVAGQYTTLAGRVASADETFSAYTRSAQEQFGQLTGQLTAWQQHYQGLEQRFTELHQQLARYEGLEQRLMEQNTLLAQYAPLQALLGHVPELMSLLAGRKKDTLK